MRSLIVGTLCLLLLGCSVQTSQKTPPSDQQSVPTLPTGQWLTPAGHSFDIGEFPTGLSLSPDGATVLAVNSGYSDHSIALMSVARQTLLRSLPIRKTWLGGIWGPYGDYLFISGGNDDKIYRFGVSGDSAWFLHSTELKLDDQQTFISPTGLSISADGDRLYAASRITPVLFQINAFDNTLLRTLRFPSPLYTCLLDESRKKVYVSEWGAGTIAVVRTEDLSLEKRIAVGPHPSAMVMDKERKRLYVTNSGANTVSVIALENGTVTETINVGLRGATLPGSTPNALALGAGDSTLYVALADNNAVAVVRTSSSSASRVLGFIPTGWYPTAVVCADSVLIVANGKGNGSGKSINKENPFEYLRGTLSFIPLPNETQLGNYTVQVLKDNADAGVERFSDWSAENPIPKSVGGPSPIKHIFYIVKEMRSYDEMYGDMGIGDGDSTFAKYGRSAAPNHQKLAREFTLFDRFFATGQTSAAGMQWALSASSNDYVEKTMPTLYGKRGGRYDFENTGIAVPSSGFLWEAAMNRGVRVRNYGLFLDEDAAHRGEILALQPSIGSITSPLYRGFDIYYSDTARAAAWSREFAMYEKGDSLPALNLIRLPNDHTAGKTSTYRTQRALVADNDLALGSIVERISTSKYWSESLIIVLETSANGGADHVDAHRSSLLLIGPHVRRSFVDTTPYTTASALRTIEAILGIPPMTQFDASATPLYRAFQSVPDLRPYTAVKNTIPLTERTIIEPKTTIINQQP